MKCGNCGKERKDNRNSRNLFCSIRCQKAKQAQIKVDAWLRGDEPGWTGKTRQLRGVVRQWLFKTRGTACSLCGWDEKHPVDGKPLTEIDHIDGDAENCAPLNLQILCPNCHSMTPTFRARNRNSKRER